MDLTVRLHEDVLADVLGRLSPRGVAASRGVCKAWRAVVDTRHLLHADLAGIFLDQHGRENSPMLFARRSTGRRVTSDFNYCCHRGDWEIMDCCNGLLLLRDCVVNPAIRQWARLPPPPPSCTVADCKHCFDNNYIVFDPDLSPHYEVFLVPSIPRQLPTGHISRHIRKDGESVSAMEWPPSPYIMQVFSSETWRWSQRSFVREGVGEAVGIVADVELDLEFGPYLYYTAYWEGALYLRCEGGFVLRITSSKDKYHLMKLPQGKIKKQYFVAPRLGKSENGVYCVMAYSWYTFEVWFLHEAHGKREWVLKFDVDVEPVFTNYPLNKYAAGSWISVEDNNVLMDDKFDWDTDNEDVVGTNYWFGEEHRGHIDFVGFHPYKEIAILYELKGRAMAYYLNS